MGHWTPTGIEPTDYDDDDDDDEYEHKKYTFLIFISRYGVPVRTITKGPDGNGARGLMLSSSTWSI